MSGDLDSYNFQMDDCVQDVFLKYFNRHSNHVESSMTDAFIISDNERNRVFTEVLKLDQEPALFGQAIVNLSEVVNLKALDSVTITQKLKELVCAPVEKILDFEFQNKNLLLEALTHRSFKETYSLNACYEKMEVLGDAILDYIANANLIKYTMFEKYNI